MRASARPPPAAPSRGPDPSFRRWRRPPRRRVRKAPTQAWTAPCRGLRIRPARAAPAGAASLPMPSSRVPAADALHKRPFRSSGVVACAGVCLWAVAKTLAREGHRGPARTCAAERRPAAKGARPDEGRLA
eukprot:6198374-Pleurochrysis_carterae.AAC.1